MMEAKSATRLSTHELAELVNQGFTGYIVPVEFDEAALEKWLAREHVSLQRSRVFFRTEDPERAVAFVLIATRDDKPRHARLVAMGIAPDFRGAGLGKDALRQIVAAEKAENTVILELETIQENPTAVALYQRAGFSIINEMPGWERGIISPDHDSLAPGQDADLQEVSLTDVDNLVKQYASPDLTWQAWACAASPFASRAFKLGHAYCIISNPDDDDTDTITLASMFVEPQHRRRGEGTRLGKAIIARFLGKKKWVVRPYYPRAYSEGIAQRLGFQEMDIHQYQMRLTLA